MMMNASPSRRGQASSLSLVGSIDDDIRTIHQGSIFSTATNTTPHTAAVTPTTRLHSTEKGLSPKNQQVNHFQGYDVDEPCDDLHHRYDEDDYLPVLHVHVEPRAAFAPSFPSNEHDTDTIGPQTVSTLSTSATARCFAVHGIEQMQYHDPVKSSIRECLPVAAKDGRAAPLVSACADEKVAAAAMLHESMEQPQVHERTTRFLAPPRALFWKRPTTTPLPVVVNAATTTTTTPVATSGTVASTVVVSNSRPDDQGEASMELDVAVNDNDAATSLVLSLGGYTAEDDSSYSYSVAAHSVTDGTATAKSAVALDPNKERISAATPLVRTSTAASVASSGASTNNTPTNLSSLAYLDRHNNPRLHNATFDDDRDKESVTASSVKTSMSRFQMMAAVTATAATTTTPPTSCLNTTIPVDLDDSVTLDDTTITATAARLVAVAATKQPPNEQYQEREQHQQGPVTALPVASSASRSSTIVNKEPVLPSEDVDQAMRRGTSMAYRADQSVMGTKDYQTIETGSQKDDSFGWPNAVTVPTLQSNHSATDSATQDDDPKTKVVESKGGRHVKARATTTYNGTNGGGNSSSRKPKSKSSNCVCGLLMVLLILVFAALAGGSVYLLFRLKVV